MADELKPAYLIAGSDRPKVDRAVARLRARYEADAIEIHAAEETSGDDAVAACNALGLFGSGSRLIVIDGVEAWKTPDAKAIADYLKAPMPGTTLALVGNELKKDAPIAKAVAAGKGEVLLWDVAQRAVARWIAEQFKVHGAQRGARGVPAARRARRRRSLRPRERGREARDVGERRRGHRGRRRLRSSRRAPSSPPWNLTDAWGVARRRRRAAGSREDARPHG